VERGKSHVDRWTKSCGTWQESRRPVDKELWKVAGVHVDRKRPSSFETAFRRCSCLVISNFNLTVKLSVSFAAMQVRHFTFLCLLFDRDEMSNIVTWDHIIALAA
jgi:hypothetical protein